MIENLRLARLYVLLLGLVTLGRWLQSTVWDVPYGKGHHIFSIVTLTVFASIFYAAFCRRWLGFSLLRAISLTITLAFLGQIVVFVSTAASYLLGINTYFNHPTALNESMAIPFSLAIKRRAFGVIANMILNSVTGALGWTMGALLPKNLGTTPR